MTLKLTRPHLKIPALLLAGCLLLWLYHTFVLKSFFKEWKAESAIAQQKKDYIKTSKETLKTKSVLDEQFVTLTEKIQAQLPQTREESEFLSAISRVANENYVHIDTMNPRPFRDLGDFKELSVEIRMEANLGNLVRFLHQMRESSVVLVANRLRLQPKSERSALLKGHLVISTIFLKKNTDE